ncbi:MAG: triose-phosphate isomerase [Deltaproteobacteria bacterium]|nr:triose-phosphate isomerase [Deltaproteobacteria bacterium]
MSERTPMIAGNWKMNLGIGDSCDLVKSIAEGIKNKKGVDVLVAPPFINIPAVKNAIGDSNIILSAQNMYYEASGAYTGEVAPQMLVENGCTHVILGHSERRSLFNESSEIVNKKVEAAIQTGLIPIVCIGETIQEREAGKTFDIIRAQLQGSLACFLSKKNIPASTIIAYEPVWAIGTGLTATPEQAQEVHKFIRNWLMENFGQETSDKIRILYGGSVKPGNAADLMSRHDIDGALVGGASLKADSFLGIINF